VYRTMLAVAGAVLLGTGVTGCGDDEDKGKSAEGSASPTSQPGELSATFEPASSGGQAVTYSPRVPEKSMVKVLYSGGGNRTQIQLVLGPLAPNMDYGAHVHTKKCGPKGDDAGPHYQDKKDPKTPSTNPQYANAQNEVWLDFKADEQGKAMASTSVNWMFRQGEANSVVIHAKKTSTEPGKAGMAGDRLACVTVPFS
jgi:superoxide dismutase, Cu-Zn family